MSNTPKTDAASRLISGHAIVAVWRGRTERAEAELARALRVVKAARGYKADDSHDDTLSLNALLDAVEEWEAGR